MFSKLQCITGKVTKYYTRFTFIVDTRTDVWVFCVHSRWEKLERKASKLLGNFIKVR